MAGILATLGTIDWVDLGRTAWTWGRESSTSAAAFLAGLPRDCRLATMHAATICVGQEPQYYAVPGFGPFGAAWGWFLAGGAVGAVVAVLLMMLTGNLRREPSIATLAAASRPAPPGLAATAHEQARQDVLTFLAAGGRPALRDLASATGLPEQDFVAALLGAQPAGNALGARAYGR